ncbi:(R)-mandelonitrile lyase-like [Rosa rugosa]|uniref:(R)-mandelonitrile lyase-like n=1 Tax=Rosa rugosa TaxID=74645 RepID=UPI002B4105F8|nr:(R)-mandelonitrile lyase-like [Rosa rugosa]
MASRLALLAFVFALVVNVVAASSSPSSQHRRRPRQEPSYLKFVPNATDFPSEDYYDYIIMGGGTAGCSLAATLSSRFRVLQLEKGGVAYGNRNLMTQEGFLAALMDVNNFDSPTQAFTSEDGVPNVRGRILGGNSAINAGFYSHADHESYKRSTSKWDLKLVNDSHELVERATVFRPDLRNWQSAVRDGLLQAGIDPYNGYCFDHVVGTKTSGSTFDTLGRRHSAADLLKYAKPLNIRVAVHATVEKVLLASSTSSPVSRQSTVGVVFRDRSGRYHHAMLRKHGEVLLSAASIGTPQLLLLSGFSPRPCLPYLEIPVHAHAAESAKAIASPARSVHSNPGKVLKIAKR